MKAIDFACHFLARLRQEQLSIPASQVLLAVAAGLEESADIVRFTGLAQSACSLMLKHLEKARLVTCVSRKNKLYRLSASGKDYVCQIFSFAKPQHPCEKNDT